MQIILFKINIICDKKQFSLNRKWGIEPGQRNELSFYPPKEGSKQNTDGGGQSIFQGLVWSDLKYTCAFGTADRAKVQRRISAMGEQENEAVHGHRDVQTGMQR